MQRIPEEFSRPGKRAGKGFYDYPEDGKKRLWEGLKQAFQSAATQPPMDEVKKRLLYIQSQETARILVEGVPSQAQAGDVGSVLGWGYSSWTGGTLSLIETAGLNKAFVAECDRLAKSNELRLATSQALRDRAARGENLYAG